ncbi:MAG TPA: hypothetical protein VJR89_19270, partial [Polyangiales bacterium]|nr:hypothetical protein [Polyangiales bacterium]
MNLQLYSPSWKPYVRVTRGWCGVVAALALGAVGAPARAQEALDPYVEVDPDVPYGTHSVRVPAGAYWVNSGVYLRPGQTADLTATGTWRVDASTGTYGPGGYAWRTNPSNGCRFGQLVARLGMQYNGRIWCIGTRATVTRPSGESEDTGDGILYLAANTLVDDGGEWTDYRNNASGAVTATVTSTADTVPTILAADAPSYDYS